MRHRRPRTEGKVRRKVNGYNVGRKQRVHGTLRSTGRAKIDDGESVTYLKSMVNSGGGRTATRPCRRRGWSRDWRAHRISGGDSGNGGRLSIRRKSPRIHGGGWRLLLHTAGWAGLSGLVERGFNTVAVGVPSAGERAEFRWRNQCPVYGHWRLSKPFCTIIISRTGSGHRAVRKNNKKK